MMPNPSNLHSYTMSLLSEGRVVFLRDEAQNALGINRRAFLDAAERLQKKGLLFAPRQGFYVIIPPQFLAWGAPPPSWYIHDLMSFEGRPYYVGLLKAAELHGASHQAVMEFQVVTDKRLSQFRAGRSRIVFYYRNNMEVVADAIVDGKSDTGQMKMSSVELTLLDLLRYPHAAGGFDNMLNVVIDLGSSVRSRMLAELSTAFERSVIQRLGYLLDVLGHGSKAESLHRSISGRSSLTWVELEPHRGAEADFATEELERNERWHVVVRRILEPD